MRQQQTQRERQRFPDADSAYGIHITKSKRAMEDIHKISGLTHRHPLAQSACGIYLAIAVRILDGYELKSAIREWIREALDWYCSHDRFQCVWGYWEMISDPDDLASLPNEIIYSGGYVVQTMETVLWAPMPIGPTTDHPARHTA